MNTRLLPRLSAARISSRLPAIMLSTAACVVALPALAAGGNTPDQADRLEHCGKTLGVVRIQEDMDSPWYRYYGGRLGSTAPVLSMLILQSNCFVVVERGTGEATLNDETKRARGDEARESDTRGKGQQVVADYLLKPEIVMDKQGTEGQSFNLGGLLPGAIRGIAGHVGFSNNEASTVLTLVDIRSTIRLAAAQGSSKNTDFKFMGGLFGGSLGAGGGAYTSTDEGKLVSAAFLDAYNKLVVSVRNYKAQTVEGGLGEGGGLGVQGGVTKASKKVDAGQGQN